jgi:hypothetical protein
MLPVISKFSMAGRVYVTGMYAGDELARPIPRQRA